MADMTSAIFPLFFGVFSLDLFVMSASQSEVQQSQDFVMGGGHGDGDVGGGGDGDGTSLSAQISSSKLILSAQGPATRLISGVGGSSRLPPL